MHTKIGDDETLIGLNDIFLSSLSVHLELNCI